eukprot:4804799-Pyramimonas_sp.AAC.1
MAQGGEGRSLRARPSHMLHRQQRQGHWLYLGSSGSAWLQSPHLRWSIRYPAQGRHSGAERPAHPAHGAQSPHGEGFPFETVGGATTTRT